MDTRFYLFALTFGLPLCSLGVIVDEDGFKAGSTNTIGTGAHSIASGLQNLVGGSSVAAGFQNEIWGNSLGVGEGNLVSSGNLNSTTLGYYNQLASSDSTLLTGQSNAAAFETGSILGGLENTILHGSGSEGLANILLGSGNTLEGTGSTPLTGSILLGVDNYSSHTMSWALGRGNIGQTGTVTLGEYSDTVNSAALIVGNGTGDSARSNALVVGKDGSVLIPSGELLLGGSSVLSQDNAPSWLGGYLSSNSYLRRVQGDNASVGTGGLLAWGNNASATGLGSVAIGADSSVAAESGIALGEDSSVGEWAVGGIAIGGATSGGPYSFATTGGQAYGTFSIAMAQGMTLSNTSIAMGGVDVVAGNWPGNVTAGDAALAIGGVGNRAEGYASVATGFWTKASAFNSIAMGSLNMAGGVSSSTWVDSDPLFELGNGQAPVSATEPSATYRSNAITTLKEGKTILTNKYWDSEDPLAVPQESISTGQALVVEGHTVMKGKVTIEKPQGDIYMGIYGN
jgi:hypothetical protein